MPKVAFLALTQRVIVDAMTQIVSAIDLIEYVNFYDTTFPSPADGAIVKAGVQPDAQVLCIWEWEEGETSGPFEVTQQIATAGGATEQMPFLEQFFITHPPVGNSPRSRSTWPISALPLDIPGRYELQILVNGSIVARLPFLVRSHPVSSAGAAT
jgi:hypothetical protein